MPKRQNLIHGDKSGAHVKPTEHESGMTVQSLPNPGSTVTAFFEDTQIEGDVLCIDHPRETGASTGRRDMCDVIIAKVEFLRDLKTVKEGAVPPCLELNIDMISDRIRRNEKIQMEKQKFHHPSVPYEVRDLAEYIEKLFDVIWDEPNIVVMEHTVISPPYKEENVTCNSETQQAKSQAEYVRKIVTRYHLDRVREGRAEK